MINTIDKIDTKTETNIDTNPITISQLNYKNLTRATAEPIKEI